VDPRTPVIVGAGQASAAARRSGARSASPSTSSSIAARAADCRCRGRPFGARRARHGCCRRQSCRGTYPDPGAPARPPARRRAAFDRDDDRRRQLAPAPRERARVRDSAGRGPAPSSSAAPSCVYTRWRARREPKDPGWTGTQADDPAVACEWWATRGPGTNDYEMAHTAIAPTQIYPALRDRPSIRRRTYGRRAPTRGERAVGRRSPRFLRPPIRTRGRGWRTRPRRSGRPPPTTGSSPSHTSSACAPTSTSTSPPPCCCAPTSSRRDLGVPDEAARVPALGAPMPTTVSFFSERESLSASPAIAAAGGSALDAAGAGIDDVARFDLYSCFPSAVEIALGALDLRGPAGGDRRPLTVTGGLGFAGGPANDYPTARDRGDGRRLPTGSGLDRHGERAGVVRHQATSIGLYSTTPPKRGFTRVDTAGTQAAVDALPGRQPRRRLPRDRRPSRRLRSCSSARGAPAVAILSDDHARRPPCTRQHGATRR